MERVNDKAVVFLPWATIEAEAQRQILNTAQMPFVFKHVAVMPDCHYGKGATVGTVLATDGAVIRSGGPRAGPDQPVLRLPRQVAARQRPLRGHAVRRPRSAADLGWALVT